jgi:taurine dioxygenase
LRIKRVGVPRCIGRPCPSERLIRSARTVLDIDGENGRANYWHTDVTFVPAFPLFSVLRGVVIPAVGGDTVWANTVAAYDTLPLVLRGLADQLWALHANAYDYAGHRCRPTPAKAFREDIMKTSLQPRRHVAPRGNDRPLVTQYSRRRV